MPSDSDPPLLLSVLRVLADPHARSLPAGTRISDVELEWLLGHGLGPLVQSVRPSSGFDAGPRADALLRGADLTSRALTQHMLAEVEDLCLRLGAAGLTPTILKGLSYATRHYPQPHLRVMGDIDLLVAAEDLAAARHALMGAGFTQPDYPWDPGHHAPPFRHDGKDLWVELHHALRPPDGPEAGEPPFLSPTFQSERRPSKLGTADVTVLSLESEVALLATEWCHDLKSRFGIAGAPRALVDLVQLLARADESHFDWDKVLRWSGDRYTGTCIAIMLTYLERHGAYVGPPELPNRILRSQRFVLGTTLSVVHTLLDRYVAAPGLMRLWSADTVGRVFDALIAPRPSWRNLVSVPRNIAFPRGHPQRFRPAYHLGRLRNLLSGRR